jgi:hypothetical protein
VLRGKHPKGHFGERFALRESARVGTAIICSACRRDFGRQA